MLEDSVESFITRFRPFATEVELLPHLEGSPLLECLVAEKVLHLMERTGPYLTRAGKVRLIINPMTKVVEKQASSGKWLKIPALSSLEAQGVVLESDGQVLVVDAGVPLVVSVLEDSVRVAQGDWVSFSSLAPVHGFVVTQENKVYHRRSEESDGL
jgi:hypothetical protein